MQPTAVLSQVPSWAFQCLTLLFSMEKIQRALNATLQFLQKSHKLDAKAYADIEASQVSSLIRRIHEAKLEIDDAAALTEAIQSSVLEDGNKSSLVRAISSSLCKEELHGGTLRQALLSGFLNYLTAEDRAVLGDEQNHPFTRAMCAVKRCIKLGCLFPCEKSYGHMVATLVQEFNMASTADDCNALLKEYKRALKSSRAGLKPSVPEFPADPISLPPGLLEQAYDGQANQVLLPSVLAAHQPGKWMRGSSKELTIGDKKARNTKPDDFFALMQNMQGMQANMKNWHRMQQFMMQMNNDDQEQPLSNLVLFPNKKTEGFGR